MHDSSMTHPKLTDKVSVLEQKIKELEQMESVRKRTGEALRVSEERYRTLVENATDLVFRTDDIGRLTFVNPAMLRITGYEEKEIIGQQYTILIHPDMRDDAMKFFGRQFVKRIQNTYSEYPMLTKDGREVWFGQNTQLIVQDNHVTGFQVVARDITERKRAEAKLRQQTDAMEAAIDGMALLNEEGVYAYLNKAHARLYDYEDVGELIGKPWRILYDSDELQRFEQEIMPEFSRRGNWHGEAVGTKKSGSKFPQELSLTATADGGFICVVRDITERKQVEEALRESENRYRELSTVDDLTQLYNSRHFYFQLKMELDRSNRYELPLSLLLLDLDNFKAFNDAYGHVEGDQVLLRLGQVVKRCLRQTDSAYRYGGEEFTILLPMTTGADGAVTAERIRTEFKKEIFSPAPGQDVLVTVSIGLGQYRPQEEMKAFVHRVDQLMYQGKKNGKDRVCCES